MSKCFFLIEQPPFPPIKWNECPDFNLENTCITKTHLPFTPLSKSPSPLPSPPHLALTRGQMPRQAERQAEQQNFFITKVRHALRERYGKGEGERHRCLAWEIMTHMEPNNLS